MPSYRIESLKEELCYPFKHDNVMNQILIGKLYCGEAKTMTCIPGTWAEMRKFRQTSVCEQQPYRRILEIVYTLDSVKL
jgi:hypothetical protein